MQNEIKHALDTAEEHPEGEIFVIPVKLDTCDVPERLRRWQWINYDEHSGYEKLVRALTTRATELGLYDITHRIEELSATYMQRAFERVRGNFRDEHPSVQTTISLAGLTGVGKSVLVSALTKGHYTFEKTVGPARIYSWNKVCKLIDVPGLDLQPEENAEPCVYKILELRSTIILYVLDASSTRLSTFEARVIEKLRDVGASIILVANRIDMAPLERLKIFIEYVEKKLRLPPVPISALEGLNIDRFRNSLSDILTLST